ncbi:sugar transporter SWEET1-like [Uranotaenia lowii]|uniref:sugar transporter SWEET1-like n=1 Tax=Uranotaenia lowii TaxID=190385 RepID=UPI00247A317E|nr:sugar transporter SWEET1-like [Uranotaenia lowii]XP_055610385.1 sugar transporter SWEET1-like [Uranotaenia lowii]
METVARELLPYRDVIGNIAGILTVAQFLSGCFTCNEIRKKGSSEGFSPMQFVLGCGLTALQLKYSQMLASAVLIRTSAYGLSICIVYSGCFLWFTPSDRRRPFFTLASKVFLLTSATIYYAGVEDPLKVKDRFGLLITVLTLAYIALPLTKLGEVVRQKSSAGLPLPVILTTTCASVLWLLYGIILNNYFIIIQKVVALGLCFLQLSLFVIYPAKTKRE